MATVGVVANPAAGKDIRRLVAEASPVSDSAKIAVVRRAVIGAVEGGATSILLADDRRSLAARAVDGLDLPAELTVLDEAISDSGANSRRAAGRLKQEGAGAVIVLGGDGTHRDVAKGWSDAPLVTLSTGTNNVFPQQREATVAGYAAGAVASGRVSLEAVADRAKRIEVDIDGVASTDLALVDVAVVSDRFTGSRAVWDGGRLRQIVAAIAEPASVGLSAIAAAVAPVGRFEPGGVHVGVAAPGEVAAGVVRVAIAPGRYEDVAVRSHRRLADDERVVLDGPGTLSFDGERDVMLEAGQGANATVRRDGPWVVDVDRAVATAMADDEMGVG